MAAKQKVPVLSSKYNAIGVYQLKCARTSGCSSRAGPFECLHHLDLHKVELLYLRLDVLREEAVNVP